MNLTRSEIEDLFHLVQDAHEKDKRAERRLVSSDVMTKELLQARVNRQASIIQKLGEAYTEVLKAETKANTAMPGTGMTKR